MPSSNPLDPTNYTTLLSGNSWHNGTGSVTFSFPANVPGDTITGLLPNERAFAELALARANEVCNVNLVAAPSGTTGEVTFRRDTGDTGFGYAYYPPDGDVFISTIADQLTAALYNTGWQTYIHELGHALGLRHPFDNSPFLNATLDTQRYTVMSYDPHPDQSSLPLAEQEWPATFMLYDIQALQSIYGANMSTRSGNTTYFGDTGHYALADGGKLIMTIWDGGGVDTIDGSNQSSAVTIDLRPGFFSSIGAVANNIAIALGVGGSTQSAWIENARGGAAGDTLTGNDIANALRGFGGVDTIDGGQGDDLIDGGTGDDQMTGGLGDDTFYVDSAGDVVNENPGGGTDQVVSSVDYTLGADVEELRLIGTAISGTGNSGNNNISGNAENNILTGGGGNDGLRGGLGDDQMIGGEGDDLYYVDAAGDQAIEIDGQGTDAVIASVDFVLGAEIEHLTLTGAAVSGTGNAEDNLIFGNILANLLDGGAGSDFMAGGGGDDTYTVDVTADRVEEASGEGTDTVLSSVSYTLAANIERLTLTGVVAINATGNALNNIITGNGIANSLRGGGGDDEFRGGDGNDVYHVDSAGDTVVEIAANGSDTVFASVDYVLSDNVEELRLTGVVALSATGNGGDNVIVGNGLNNFLFGGEGHDALRGGLGDDQMTGNDGDDIYYVDAAGDQVFENASEGRDTILSTITYTMADHVEDLELIGSSIVDGTGNSVKNIIAGNAMANVLTGLGGDDVLNGRNGDDRLIGGAGADQLTGGAGVDRFVFETLGDGVDLIFDFSGGTDIFVISAGGFGGGLSAGGGVDLVLGSSAVAATGTFLYDSASLSLAFDVDGIGALNATFLTFFTAAISISATDFEVIV